MNTCTRILEWDMGHRVLNHEGKCARLHGHRYSAHVTATAEVLDDVGRVVDFGVIKTALGNWVDATWDHKTMLFSADKQLIDALPSDHVVVVHYNPTAENIARLLYGQAVTQLSAFGVLIQKVRVWETPNCYADYVQSK